MSVPCVGGVAFLGARTRDCCTPAGVFLSINTLTSSFGLFTTLVDASTFNVTNALTSGTGTSFLR